MSLVLDGTSGSTGTGAFALANSPSLVTPNLGTPSSVNLTNATNVPVNQATGTLAVANGGTGVTTKTGTGNVVLSTSPVLTSPSITSGSLTMSDSTTITSGQQVAKAWVSYNASTQTIRSSYNCSSVTRNAATSYTFNVANAFPDSNYAAVCTVGGTTNNYGLAPWTSIVASTTQIGFTHNGSADSTYISLIVFR